MNVNIKFSCEELSPEMISSLEKFIEGLVGGIDTSITTEKSERPYEILGETNKYIIVGATDSGYINRFKNLILVKTSKSTYNNSETKKCYFTIPNNVDGGYLVNASVYNLDDAKSNKEFKSEASVQILNKKFFRLYEVSLTSYDSDFTYYYVQDDTQTILEKLLKSDVSTYTRTIISSSKTLEEKINLLKKYITEVKRSQSKLESVFTGLYYGVNSTEHSIFDYRSVFEFLGQHLKHNRAYEIIMKKQFLDFVIDGEQEHVRKVAAMLLETLIGIDKKYTDILFDEEVCEVFPTAREIYYLDNKSDCETKVNMSDYTFYITKFLYMSYLSERTILYVSRDSDYVKNHCKQSLQHLGNALECIVNKNTNINNFNKEEYKEFLLNDVVSLIKGIITVELFNSARYNQPNTAQINNLRKLVGITVKIEDFERSVFFDAMALCINDISTTYRSPQVEILNTLNCPSTGLDCVADVANNILDASQFLNLINIKKAAMQFKLK